MIGWVRARLYNENISVFDFASNIDISFAVAEFGDLYFTKFKAAKGAELFSKILVSSTGKNYVSH